jgi:orotate phosphoribosyltransferase
MALAADKVQSNVPYCCNRKEHKDHGEGGVTFGAPLQGKVLIIDDVISSGTSINLSRDIIEQAGATASGIVVALDRQERGNAGLSAVQEVAPGDQIKFASIITLDDIVSYLKTKPEMSKYLERMLHHQHDYGLVA